MKIDLDRAGPVAVCLLVCTTIAVAPRLASADESRPLHTPKSISFWMEPNYAGPNGYKGNLPWFREHYKDPGLMRREYFDGPIPPKQKQPAKLRSYQIRKLVGDELHCYGVNVQHERRAIGYHVTYGDRYRKTPDHVANWWKRIRTVTSDPARRVGEETVKGEATTVFETAGEKLWGPPPRDPGECTSTLRIWVSKETKLPVRIRWRGRHKDKRVYTQTMEDVRWNADYPDGFFEVPKGWEILRSSDLHYLPEGTRLGEGITFKCSIEDGPVAYDQSDVIRVGLVEVSPMGYVGRIYVRHSPSVVKRWQKIRERLRGAAVIWDFNGEIRVRLPQYTKDSAPPRSFDLSSLRCSWQSFKHDYLASPTDKPAPAARPDF